MQKKRTRKTPTNLLPLLQLAAQPGARLIFVADTAFILHGKTHKYVHESICDVLLEEGWITSPRQITPGLAESSVTHAGYARLAALEAQKRKYTQLMLAL